MARISKARKQKTRHLMEAEILSDEHILHLAKQAVAKVRVPPGIMTYEERLASALYGIANGYWKFNPENFQSTREWLSMQAYYQIKTDAAKRTRTLSRETAIEEPERIIENPSAPDRKRRKSRSRQKTPTHAQQARPRDRHPRLSARGNVHQSRQVVPNEPIRGAEAV